VFRFRKPISSHPKPAATTKSKGRVAKVWDPPPLFVTTPFNYDDDFSSLPWGRLETEKLLAAQGAAKACVDPMPGVLLSLAAPEVQQLVRDACKTAKVNLTASSFVYAKPGSHDKNLIISHLAAHAMDARSLKTFLKRAPKFFVVPKSDTAPAPPEPAPTVTCSVTQDDDNEHEGDSDGTSHHLVCFLNCDMCR